MSVVESGRSRVIDAHHHLWDPQDAPDDYAWLSGPYAAIDREFTPQDLRPELAAAGVDATVLVQTRSSLVESRDFLRVAESTDFIAGVVAWLDLTGADAADVIANLRAGTGGGYLAGIRHQVHNEDDPAWLDRADVRRGLAAVEAAGLPYDLLLRPREMPAGLDIARAMPDLPFVIDHLAKPLIASGEMDAWSRLMAPFGELPNVSCKVSGMVTEADHLNWTIADLRPYVERVLEIFGPERLMFGSDWPVCLVAASYETVVSTTRALIADLSAAERAAIMGGTASRVYGLSP
jgi:L-fuconolactonase